MVVCGHATEQRGQTWTAMMASTAGEEDVTDEAGVDELGRADKELPAEDALPDTDGGEARATWRRAPRCRSDMNTTASS